MKGYVSMFLLLAGTAVFAQSSGTPEQTAVLNVQQQWLEASQKGNAEALRQIIDDSFVGNTPDNHIVNKQDLVPSGGQPMFSNVRFENLEARVIGDTAVVFGKMTSNGDLTALRFAMVYSKQSGGWRMIAAQLVPVPETKGARVQ
jgi:hypothetical protein